MNMLTLLWCVSILLASWGLPVDQDSLQRKLADHRIDLLENGFNVFADEFVSVLITLQEEVKDFTDTNNELRKQIHDVTAHDNELTKTVKEQDKVISDLLWAVADLKERRKQNFDIGELRHTGRRDKDELLQIEWSLFDLKQSTEQILEEMCLHEVKCGEWSRWSRCSVDCGIGVSTRTRSCSKSGKFQSYCEPPLTETKECSGNSCTLRTLTSMACPQTFVYFESYCLRFSGRSDTRNLARLICEADDSHLVEIDSPQKQTVVMDYLKVEIPIYMRYAAENPDIIEYSDLGYIDNTSQIAIDGVQRVGEIDYINWRNQRMNYFNWAKGQPNREKIDDDCCVTVSLEDYKWYSNSCSERFYYVCETSLMEP